jgi:hypothetical protein
MREMRAEGEFFGILEQEIQFWKRKMRAAGEFFGIL